MSVIHQKVITNYKVSNMQMSSSNLHLPLWRLGATGGL